MFAAAVAGVCLGAGWMLPAAGDSAASATCRLPQLEQIVAEDRQGGAGGRDGDHSRLRAFALFSYRSIASDVINGRGQYLETLVTVFAHACGDRQALIEWLRALLSSTDTVADFARRLTLAHALAAPARPPGNEKN
ncbi:MAG TPA: hypothetical protein VEL28_15520 [Candidatus Binatia bacterium]|nr:hypothetical protein [Candidatus Binatia bacterium]